MKKIISILLTLFISVSMVGCSNKDEVTKDQASYFDTVVTLSVYGKNGEEEIQKCFDECERLQNIFSRTDENSELYKLNHRDSNSVEVSDELAELIKVGLKYHAISDGAFDITIAPLSDLWDFKSEDASVPSKSKIKKQLAKVDSDSVHVKGNTVTFDNDDTMIDLGAIVKGYAADDLKAILEDDGVTSAIINLGGNVLCVGSKPDGSDYTVGIQKPFDENGESITTIKVSDKSVVSSGIYQRYFKQDGKIYHHILDARTGYPMDNGLYQVTIISNQSLDGDILSTVTFLMGEEKGKEYIESLDGIEAIFVDSDYNIVKTSGLE